MKSRWPTSEEHWPDSGFKRLGSSRETLFSSVTAGQSCGVIPKTYNLNPPGIGLEVAAWVIEKKASMVGSDSWPTEVWPNPNPEFQVPVHQELITKNGIFNLENMVFEELVGDGVYEFLFIHTPIRFKGATGSPARPIAVR